MINFFDDLSKYGDSIALITQDSKFISYRMLSVAADDLGKHFDGRCLIFILARNDLESVVGYLGALRSRVVPVLIASDMHPGLLRNLVEKYQPKYLWLPQDHNLSLDQCDFIYSYNDYSLLKIRSSLDYPLHDSLAQLLTTSGSTGSPKLVRQSYLNINSNASSIAQCLKIVSTDRPITTLPISYTYGLSIITSHLLNGCSIILNNYTLMEKSFWVMMKTHAATTFGGVPYIFEMLKKLRFSRMELPSLKVITQAGGGLPKEVVKEFADVCAQKGINFVVMYGQTEATARMSFLPTEYLNTKPSSIGIPIPGGQFWIEDDKKQIIANHNVEGELVYAGLNVSMGYALSFADLSKGDEMNGVLRTGDIAKRDEDGFYYIVGRKARFLKLFGKRVSLDEVEHLLRGAGFDCACSGSDDKLKIFLVGGGGSSEVIDFIVQHAGIHSSGFEVISVNELPRNGVGKILYEKLNAQDSLKI